jgi:hypothetical protein
MTPELLAAMHNQEQLDALADLVRARAGDAAPGTGLSGIVVDPRADSAQIYWHGAVPAWLADQAGAARRARMAVDIRSAPYTAAELAGEIDRMTRMPLATKALTSANRRVLTASPLPDGTGIAVTVSGLPTGTTVDQARQLVPALSSSVPLQVSFDGTVPTARFYDFWPWWGGAYIENGVGCSDAFGVTGNNGASTYMLTAAHCGTGTWTTGTVVLNGTPTNRTLGATIPGRDLNHDAEAILTAAPHPSGAGVYYGSGINPPNGDLGTNNGLSVGGAAGNTIGDLICTDGSFTGTVCGVRVGSVGATVVYDPPENGVGRTTGMVNAQLPGVAIVGNGDSGGPIFALRTSDSRAIARGVISGEQLGSYERPCTGYAPAGRRCSMSVWYGPIIEIMNVIGVHINTQ